MIDRDDPAVRLDFLFSADRRQKCPDRPLFYAQTHHPFKSFPPSVYPALGTRFKT
jgi:hypothetical protein